MTVPLNDNYARKKLLEYQPARYEKKVYPAEDGKQTSF